LPSVRLGTYTVASEASGFRRALIQDVVVEVGGTVNLVVAMQVGTLAGEVTVTAEAAQVNVNTVDAELSTVVDNRRVLELPPLNRANFNVPTLNITSSNFGQITRTVTSPRLMQFAVKVNF